MQAVRKIITSDKGHYPSHLLSFLNSSNVENAPLIGDTFSKEDLSWLAKGDKLVFIRKEYPAHLIDFNDYFQDPVTVRCGIELDEGDGKGFLLLAGDTSLGGFIAYFLPVTCCAVRIVQLDLPVRCVCPVEKEGAPVSPLPTVCASMSGVIALGCSDGSVILMDLCTNLLQKGRCGEWPERMSKAVYIYCGDCEEVVAGKTDAAIADGDSIAFIINGAGGQLDAQQDHLTNGYFSVSSLYYCPQAAALFVGYSKGQWFIWNLTNFTILFSSGVEAGRSSGPVRGMAVLEPADDPRPCLYLWVAHDSPSYCFMYALYFNNKSHINQYGVYYKDFEQCCDCYEQQMSRGLLDNVLTGVMGVQSLVHSSSSPLKSEKEEVRLFVSTWWVEGPGGGRDLVVWLVDLDQWYRAQLPACAPAAAALTAYTSCSVVPPTEGLGHPLAFLLSPQSLTPYRSLAPHDQHYHPASITFKCLVVGREGVMEGVCLGVQEELLASMSTTHLATSCQDDLMMATCRMVGLTPLLEDILDLSSFPFHLQRAGHLMTVAIENRRENVVIDSLKLWYDSACVQPIMSLDFISQLLCILASTYRNKFHHLCVPLFDRSGMEVSDAEYAWLRHCHLMISTLRRIFLHIIKQYPTFDISEVEVWTKAVGLISVYMDLILLLLHLKLLPERTPSDQPTSSPSSLETDFALLTRLTSDRRETVGGELLVEEVARRWREEGEVPHYPAKCLQHLVRMSLSVSLDPRTKHLLLYYTLLDLLPQLTLTPHRRKEFRLSIETIASTFGLRTSENKLVEAICHIDNQRFQEGVEQLCCEEVSVEQWLVGSVLGRLVRHEQFHAAHYLLLSKGHLLDTLPFLRLQVTVYVAVDNLPSALSVCKSHPLHRESLLSHCFQESVKHSKMRNMLKLPLSQSEEDSLLKFLKSSKLPFVPELIIYLHLSRLRYAEAFAAYEQMERGGVWGRTSERGLKWEALMAGLKRSLGPIHRINMYEWHARTEPLPHPFNQEGRGWKPASSYLKLDRSDDQRPRISSSLKEFSSIAIWQARALKDSHQPPPRPASLTREENLERQERVGSKRGGGQGNGEAEEKEEEEQVVKKRPRLEVCSSPVVAGDKVLLEHLVSTPIIAHSSTPSSTTPHRPPPSILKRSGTKEEHEEDGLTTPRKTLTFREPCAHRMSIALTSEKEACEEEEEEEEEMTTSLKPAEPDIPDEDIDLSGKLDSTQLDAQDELQQTQVMTTCLVHSPENRVHFVEDPKEEDEQVEKGETIKDEVINNLEEKLSDGVGECIAEVREAVGTPRLDDSEEDVVCLDSDSESETEVSISSNRELLPCGDSEDNDTDDSDQQESSEEFQMEELSQDSVHQELPDDVTTVSSSSESPGRSVVDENQLDYSSASEFPRLSLDFDSETSSGADTDHTDHKVNRTPSSIATDKPLVEPVTPLAQQGDDIISNTFSNVEQPKPKTHLLLQMSNVKSNTDSDCSSIVSPHLEPDSPVNVTKDKQKPFIADVSVLMESIRNSIKPGISDSCKSQTLVVTVNTPDVSGSGQNVPNQAAKVGQCEAVSQSDGLQCDTVTQVFSAPATPDIVSKHETSMKGGLSSQTEGEGNHMKSGDVIEQVGTSLEYAAECDVSACLPSDPGLTSAANQSSIKSVVDTVQPESPPKSTSTIESTHSRPKLEETVLVEQLIKTSPLEQQGVDTALSVVSKEVSLGQSNLKHVHRLKSEGEVPNSTVPHVGKPQVEKIAPVECLSQTPPVQFENLTEPKIVSPLEVVNNESIIEGIVTQITSEEKSDVISSSLSDSMVQKKSLKTSCAELPEEFTLNNLPADTQINCNKEMVLKDTQAQITEETLDERNSMWISGDFSESDLLNRAIVEEEVDTHADAEVSKTVESLNLSVNVGFEVNKTPRKKSRRTTVMVDQSVMTDKTRYSLGYKPDEPQQAIITVPPSQDDSQHALPDNVGKEVHQASRKKRQVRTEDKCVSTDSTTLKRKSKRLSDALNNAFVAQQERTFIKARRRSSRASSEEPSASVSFRERRRSSSQTDTEPVSFSATLTKGQSVSNKLLRVSRASSEEPVGPQHRSDPTKSTSHDDRNETSASYTLRSRDSLRAVSNPSVSRPSRRSETVTARGQPVLKAVRRLSKEASHKSDKSDDFEWTTSLVRSRRGSLRASSEPPETRQDVPAARHSLPRQEERLFNARSPRATSEPRHHHHKRLSGELEPVEEEEVDRYWLRRREGRRVGSVLPDIQEQPEEDVRLVNSGTRSRVMTPGRRRTLSSSSGRRAGSVLPDIQEQPEEDVRLVNSGTRSRARTPGRRRTLSSSSEPPAVLSNCQRGVEILRRGAPIYRSSLSLHQPDSLQSSSSPSQVESGGDSEDRRQTRHQQAVSERASTPTTPTSRRKRRSSNMAGGSGDEATPTRVSLRLLSRKGKESPLPPTP